MKVSEAAQIMDVSPQFIRLGLQQARLPIGTAVRTSENRWTYDVQPHLISCYMGKEAYQRACKNYGLLSDINHNKDNGVNIK